MTTMEASVAGKRYPLTREDKECVHSHVYSDQSTDCMGFKLNHN